MQKVTFGSDYDHITPTVTTAYKAGQSLSVANDVAEKARAAGKLEEADGRGSDKGGAASGSDALEGDSNRNRSG